MVLATLTMIVFLLLCEQYTLVWDTGYRGRNVLCDLLMVGLWVLILKFPAVLKTQDDSVVW